ncbi:hypothetical protein QR685DRAFT_252761 [Neurospora intermedia]|uniref:Uncharacterized protein n=1 Tax=Neurospora intermedia TaxID=5142 RepID=A0ABR3DCK2_NEUIN
MDLTGSSSLAPRPCWAFAWSFMILPSLGAPFELVKWSAWLAVPKVTRYLPTY